MSGHVRSGSGPRSAVAGRFGARAVPLFVALAVLAAGFATARPGGAARAVRGFDGSTITVAALGIKTQLPNAEAGARARLQRFNDTHEIKGITIDYKEFVDDKQDPATALSEVRRLVSQDGVFALVGSVSGSNPTDYLAQQHVPSFGGGFDSAYCTPKPSTAIWGFSPLGCTVPHDPSFVYDAMSGGYEYVSKQLAKKHPTEVVFGANTEIGKDGARIVAVAAEGAGFDVTAVQNDYELPVSDFSPFVNSIMTGANGKAPDVAYCTGGVECIGFNDALKARGFTGVFWHAIYSDLLVKPMEGTIVSIYAANPRDDSPGLRQIKADMDAFTPGGSQKIDIGTLIGYTSCRTVMRSDGTTWKTVVPFGCSGKTYSPNLKLG